MLPGARGLPTRYLAACLKFLTSKPEFLSQPKASVTGRIGVALCRIRKQRNERGVRQQVAVEQHGPDAPRVANVGQRIRIEQHQIGALADGNGTHAVRDSEK